MLNSTIRLFVSSTFSDMKAERDVLQNDVFPKLKRLCLSKGLRFQAIDLRWGVPEEAGRDNQTMRICLRELRRCQAGRLKPNFLVLLGDRYGWRPLPEVIPSDLFAQLKSRIRKDSPRALPLLIAAYRRDGNAVPPVYELGPRDGDAGTWQESIAQPLLEALGRAARAIGLAFHDPAVAIGPSATEQEILAGALWVEDAPHHVRAFFRTIEGMPADPPPEAFVDTLYDGSQDESATGKLNELKKRLGSLGEKVVECYNVPWRDGGIDQSDLVGFANKVLKAVTEVVLTQIAAIERESGEDAEESAHRDFAEERTAGGVKGREKPMREIARHLRESGGKPLAVLGPAGSGKSALIAEAVARARKSHPNAVVLARFIGATPESTDLLALLRDLVGRMRKAYPRTAAGPAEPAERSRERPGAPSTSDTEIPADFNKLVNAFHDALSRATPDRPLILFLDALDQLGNNHRARDLVWFPNQLPECARLVVSAALPSGPGPATTTAGTSQPGVDPRSQICKALETRATWMRRINLDPLGSGTGATLLKKWLGDRGRRLQPAQRLAVLRVFADEGNPLWLRAAVGEVARLRHCDAPPDLPPTVPALLQKVMDRLSTSAEHGGVLVDRTLGYLAAARHGLAEDEIVSILGDDPEVMSEVIERSPTEREKSPADRIRSLPVAIWVRFLGDVEGYLTEHLDQGSALIGFYHRSFADAVQTRSYKPANRDLLHEKLAAWFEKQDFTFAPVVDDKPPAPGTLSDPPNLRKVSELPWHLRRVAEEIDPEGKEESVWQAATNLLCDMRFVEAKVRLGLVWELQDDYRLLLTALPEARAEAVIEHLKQDRLDVWTRELVAYAKKWSDIRDGRTPEATGGKSKPESPGPILPELPPTCRIMNDNEIAAESRRIIENPTRIDKLKAFADFVSAEFYPLLNFGKCEGFVLQHAFSCAPAGPVHDAAAGLLSSCNAPLILRRWPKDAVWNPWPALQRVLEGHLDRIGSVSVTPDGRRAISGSEDKTLRVWDLESGECLRTLEGHSRVVSLSVTPDGRRAVSGSTDTTLRVWDLESGQCVGLSAAPAGVLAVNVVGHSSICAGTADGAVLIFDIRGPRAELKPDSPPDSSDKAYEYLLRRGLEFSRSLQGGDHPETLAHLAALATYLGKMGKAEAAAAARGEHDLLTHKVAARVAQEQETADLRAVSFHRRGMALEAFRSGDHPRAERLLRSLLADGFEVPGTRCHLARIALVTERDAEARDHANAAWDARTETRSYIVPRILWFQTAAALLDGADPTPFLGRLKTALAVDGAIMEWTMAPVLAALAPRISIEAHALLTALVAALSDPSQIPALDQDAAWRASPALPLE